MTRQKLPSLLAIRAFEAVGRTQSIRASGAELRVSHTVISRHLQNLQRSLRVNLVQRQGRGLVLTESGAAYHTQIAQAFELIERATATVQLPSRSAIRLWCTPGVAYRRLLARLPEITGPPYNWEVNIQPTLSHPDLSRAEADAEIIFGKVMPLNAELLAETLVQPRVFPVASPGFLARWPAIKSLADLSRIPLIHEQSNEQWEQWLDAAGLTKPVPLKGQLLWHAHLAIEAARLGHGIALANEVLVEGDLRSGALVELFPTHVYMGAYQFVALKERWNDPMVVALRRWSRQALNIYTGA